MVKGSDIVCYVLKEAEDLVSSIIQATYMTNIFNFIKSATDLSFFAALIGPQTEH